ncbi:nucleotidyltransferase family protein [Acidocella sp.]|uniref:nucleotidyltransferase family protein n=1 Tax=Acidocella sp. TaxID=50710 RepID=UPI003CFE8766
MSAGHRIAILVLAAGQSRRMGARNKLLLRLPSGKTILRAVLEQAVEADAGPVVMVTGHERELVAREAAGLPVRGADAPDYREGLAASLRAGLAAVPEACAGALICLGDMPFVTAATLRALCAAFAPEAGRDIVQPVFEGRPGNPVLWGRRHFAVMSCLRGDEGARSLLEDRMATLCRLEVASTCVLEDIDTPEQFQSCLQRLG